MYHHDSSRRNELILEALGSSTRAVSDLFDRTVQHPLHRALFESKDRTEDVLGIRLEAFRGLRSVLEDRRTRPNARVRKALRVLSPFEIWSVCFPLAEAFISSGRRIFGFAGAPGAGKSTLATAVVTCMKTLPGGRNPVTLSLDDFYYPRELREDLGFAWRGAPGTHDVSRALEVLERIRDGDAVHSLPRYDHGSDRPAPPETFDRPVSEVVLEGWFVGNPEISSYEKLHRLIDHLVFLDVPLELAKERRFGREVRHRADGAGQGLSKAAMEAFWEEVLEPGVQAWVVPVKEHAQLLLRFDGSGDVLAAFRRDSQSSSASNR